MSKLSKETFSANGDAPSTESLDAGPLEALLDEGEAIEGVLASEASVTLETDEKTTSITPGGDAVAYLVVTNQRLFVTLGDDPDDPEVTLRLADVTDASLKDGLLKTTLSIATPDQRVGFEPADVEAARSVRSYVDRIGSAWADLADAIARVEAALEDVEAAVEEGRDPINEVQRARTRVSKAYHCATHHDDAPSELMKSEIEPVEADLRRMRVEPRVDRVQELVRLARESREAGDYRGAFGHVAEARDVLADARQARERVDADLPELGTRIERYARTLEEGVESMFDGAEQAAHRALQSDEPDEAVDAWEAALARYRGALEAEWDGPYGPTREALKFQLAWVVGNLIEALERRAADHESAGDDLGEDHDDAADAYQAARADLERARDLAAEHPHASPDPFETPIERVGEKAERAEWEWGAAD